VPFDFTARPSEPDARATLAFILMGWRPSPPASRRPAFGTAALLRAVLRGFRVR
jgi:hypothetical protein